MPLAEDLPARIAARAEAVLGPCLTDEDGSSAEDVRNVYIQRERSRRNPLRMAVVAAGLMTAGAVLVTAGAWHLNNSGLFRFMGKSDYGSLNSESLDVLAEEDTDGSHRRHRCHTVVDKKEHCWKSVHWAMRDGIYAHPEWYPNLTHKSTWYEFQLSLYNSPHARCPRPCSKDRHKKTQVAPEKPKWPFPSLFCYCVTATGGPEVELVRMQIKKKVGIFRCDEHMVLSHGGKAWLHDKVFAVEIHAPQERMGNPNSEPGVTTSSWLNTMTFMEAWKLIRKDYRFRAHDWTLKADPDAVVIPWRIRELVRPHSVRKPRGTRRFFLNCNRQSPNGPIGDGKLYGSVEIYSTGALETFFWATSPGKNIDDCIKELPADKWGEDLFMQRCMEMLGTEPVQQFGWVADNRCIPGSCSDQTKCAHHDFKFTAKARGYDHSWEWCWDQAIAAEKQ